MTIGHVPVQPGSICSLVPTLQYVSSQTCPPGMGWAAEEEEEEESNKGLEGLRDGGRCLGVLGWRQRGEGCLYQSVKS